MYNSSVIAFGMTVLLGSVDMRQQRSRYNKHLQDEVCMLHWQNQEYQTSIHYVCNTGAAASDQFSGILSW